MNSALAPRTFLSQLTGSFSQGAAENPTVAMIEAAYRHHGLDARYINCEVWPGGLRAAVRGAWAMGWAGFNCSIPHKLAVIEYLDGLDDSAALIGAVNCVVRRRGRWIGVNTDGQGFLSSLQTVVDPRGKTMLLFGAGGAGRAIAVESALAGVARVTIVNRSAERGTELAELINDRTPAHADYEGWDTTQRIPRGIDIVVNATSIGMAPHVDDRLDLDLDGLRPGMIVADVIPNPPRTALLREASARGAVTLDGLGMLVNQGVISVGHWTGIEVDAAVMRSTVEEFFER